MTTWVSNGAEQDKIATSRMSISFPHHPSLIAYFTCGDPDLDTSREIIFAALDSGASIIELGVPFSDPVADGPVIERASQRALRKGTDLGHVIQLASDIRKRSDAGLIIFSYLNPIMRFGLSDFASALKDAGVDGALITDLPVEESHSYLDEMRRRKLSTVFLAAPTSTDARLKQIANHSSGFVYVVSRTGVTGARQQSPEDARNLVQRIRKYTKLPVAVGFGISTAEQFCSVGKFAEGAVVGSALVELIERSPGKEAKSVAEFVEKLVSRNR